MASFLNETITGNNGPATNETDIDWAGGPGMFAAHGTFDDATFQLQFSLDGTTWADVPGAELTLIAADIGAFQLGPCKLRVSWSGGTDSVNVKVRVVPSWPSWYGDPATLPGT